MTQSPQQSPFNRFLGSFFLIGGVVCIAFVGLMCGLINQYGRQTQECFSPPRLGDEYTWFTSQLHVDTSAVPNPVSITTDTTASNPVIMIKNPSAEPVYELYPSGYSPAAANIWNTFLDTALPYSLSVVSKVVSDTVYYPIISSSNDLTWEARRSGAIVVGVQYIINDLNIRSDDRPAHVAPPEPQTQPFFLLYKDNVLPVTLTQSYHLNPAYNPIPIQPNPRNLPSCDLLGDARFGALAYVGYALACVGGFVAILVILLLIRGGAAIQQYRQRK